MRFPSLALVFSEAIRVTRRFPLVVLAAGVAAGAGLLAVDSPRETEAQRLMFTAALGLPLFVALTLLGERRPWPAVSRWGLPLLGVGALVGLFLAWPSWSDPVAVRRYIQLSLGAHLLVAIIPYVGSGPMPAFWQYNKTLFLRFLVAGLYAAVLFGGLAIALVALDKLFGVDVDETAYFRLWILDAFLFTTFFFLGGIPRTLEGLAATDDYPRGLRVFSQFILLPIVTLYLVILTLYLGKIAVTRVWPSGWIGYLVSSVSVLGILSLLLVFPIQEREENRWVQTYSRGFYIVLLPSVGMLLLAIWKRVDQYGITENRYFMVVLSVWLAALSIYSIANRSRNIKVIPVTLCALAFLTAFGPWGAYAVATSSQQSRLEGVLTRTGILVEGRIRRPEDRTLPEADRIEISAGVDYLVETHGVDPLRPWFEDGLAWADSVELHGMSANRGESQRLARRIVDEMGVDYTSPRALLDVMNFNYWTQAMTEGLPVSGYDHVFAADVLPGPAVGIAGRELHLVFDRETTALRFKEGTDPLISVPLGEVIERVRKPQPPGTAPEPLEPLRARNDRIAVQITIRNLSGIDRGNGPEVTGFNALVFVRFP